MCWTLINVPCCYLSECSQSYARGSCRCGDQYKLFALRFDILCLVCFFREGRERHGSQGPDCTLNFLPLGQLARDHADHPSCWVCVLSRPFPSVQTMPEVNPSTAMERRRCGHCVCQVRALENLSLFLVWSYLWAPHWCRHVIWTLDANGSYTTAYHQVF